MLGRALHYAQDGAFSRKRYPILDVHGREEESMSGLAASPQSVEGFCKKCLWAMIVRPSATSQYIEFQKICRHENTNPCGKAN